MKCFDDPSTWFGGMGELDLVHDEDHDEDEPAGHEPECECEACLEVWEREREGAMERTLIAGFCSWPDGSFELILRRQDGSGETILKGTLEPGQFDAVDRLLPTCLLVEVDAKKP